MPADWRKACGLSDANEQNFKSKYKVTEHE